MSLILSYSVIWLLLCPLAGFLYALLLYRRQSGLFKKPTLRILFFLRFFAVTILALLLAGLLVRYTTKRYQKPVVIYAVDHSQSMISASDSMEVRKRLPELEDYLEQNLGEDFEIVHYRFGENAGDTLSYGFQDGATDMAGLFSGIADRFSGRVVSAVVLASDGLVNRGVEPLSVTESKLFPVFAVAFGDTLTRRDLVIKKVNYNRLAFLGSTFPVEIIVRADESMGVPSTVSIWEGNRRVWDESFTPSSASQVFTFQAGLKAQTEGLVRYTVRVEAVRGEVQTRNNTQPFYIEIRDSRLKVLILAEAPHPDIAALRNVFAIKGIYEDEYVAVNSFSGNLVEYDLLIFHQVPGMRNPAGKWLDQAFRSGIPMLFVLGRSTDVARFNSYNTGLNITGHNGGMTDGYPIWNSAFGLFTTDEKLRESFSRLPPLVCPAGNYSLSPSASVYLYQKIAGVETGLPLITFQTTAENRVGVITGEGLWWWKNKLYQMHRDETIFQEMVSKMVQYLASNQESGNFRVRVPARIQENEHLEVEAELYNATFERINQPSVRMEISGEDGTVYPFEFSRLNDRYSLDAGTFKPGLYKWKALTEFDNQRYSAEGAFVAEPLLAELMNLKADHSLLYNLSVRSGGRLLYPAQTDSLPAWIRNLDNAQTQVFTDESFREPVDFWMLMVLLVILAGTEWAVRKYSGTL